MNWKCFIPSKGRPKSKLFEQLPDAILVVEPQDEAYYFSENPKHRILVLPEDDQGIVYVRNFIKDFAADNYIDWFWMLDDDIQTFQKFKDGKGTKMDALTCLGEVERATSNLKYEPCMVALEYAQFAWSSNCKIVKSGYCDSVVAINTKRTSLVRYREEAKLKEDRDFVVQNLAMGNPVARFTEWAFSAPANGSNEGGLFEVYNDEQSNHEIQAVKNMCGLWGNEICKAVKKKNGRIDVRINWRHFKF